MRSATCAANIRYRELRQEDGEDSGVAVICGRDLAVLWAWPSRFMGVTNRPSGLEAEMWT